MPECIDEILLETEEKMLKTVEVFERELAGIHTGRASTSLVENIQIETYGTMMRLRDVAGISTPDARTIAIQPWDASNVALIEKAIQKSSLGVSPRIDGKVVRIFLPQPTEERRRELDKVCKKYAENSRVAIRNERREGLEAVKKTQKDGKITEDEQATAEKDVQKLTDQYVAEIERHLAEKEKEIMTV
ncbi:MAG: ribosome recycling factor [Verrucomicrobia bacterium]|nr:ribosome recycling factor [Verrucomicrobiota bacterium]